MKGVLVSDLGAKSTELYCLGLSDAQLELFPAKPVLVYTALKFPLFFFNLIQ